MMNVIQYNTHMHINELLGMVSIGEMRKGMVKETMLLKAGDILNTTPTEASTLARQRDVSRLASVKDLSYGPTLLSIGFH